MIGWLFGIGLRRPVAIRRRRPSRQTRRFARIHQGHGIRAIAGAWWCPRCRATHRPSHTTRWRIN